MRICVAIPSYRKDRVKTLRIVPWASVYVAESEAERYSSANPGADIRTVPDHVQGNLCRVRNHILDELFDAGADVVCLMDDDYDRFCTFENDVKLHRHGRDNVPVEDFDVFLQHYSLLCDEFGFKLWGVNPNKDRLSYSQFQPFSTTAIINGPFQVHLKNPIRYDERLPLKEDYDISLQHLNTYRGVLRVNAYHYECDQANAKGGCASYRNREREREQMELLMRKWGRDIVREDVRGGARRVAENRFGGINPRVYVPIDGV